MIAGLWRDGWAGRALLVALLVAILMTSATVYLVLEDEKKWEAFKQTHACKVVGHLSGSVQSGVGFGLTANGQMGTVVTTTSTPDKTGWLCDDGVTYWR